MKTTGLGRESVISYVYTQMLFHLSLPDPSPIMLSLTNSLTDTCLVDLIYVTPVLGWLGHKNELCFLRNTLPSM